MGEEHGETRPFLYFTSHTDAELGKAVSEGRRAEFIAEAKEVPDPQAERTFRDSRPARNGDEALRVHYRKMLALRRRYRQVIASTWPRVRREGRAYRLERPGLTVTVNLGAEPALELPGWGWEVLPR
jgi:maltooligosyltrehalose trehalohydrolase